MPPLFFIINFPHADFVDIVMELVNGGDLLEYIHKRTRLGMSSSKLENRTASQFQPPQMNQQRKR